MCLYASAGTCATLSIPCQPPPTLPIHFPFPPCSCRSVHVASLHLRMLQEASINMHIHSRGVSGAASPSPSHQGNACPIPVSWSQSRRGRRLGEVESEAIPALCSAADIDECANETLCGSHGFCENSDGSFRCLCDRGYESSPSGHYCVGESPAVALPVSEGEPSAMPGWCPRCVMAPGAWMGTASMHGESQTRTGQLMEAKPLPLAQQILRTAKEQGSMKRRVAPSEHGALLCAGGKEVLGGCRH